MLLLLGVSVCAGNEEDRLLKYLFETRAYNHRVRPVKNHVQSVCVNTNLRVVQLQQIVEKDQVMTIQCVVHMVRHGSFKMRSPM